MPKKSVSRISPNKEIGFFTSIAQKTKHILLAPNDFFQKDIKPTIRTAFVYFLFIYLFHILLTTIIYSQLREVGWMPPVLLISGLIGIFVWAVIVYGYCWIFGGRTTYTKLFQVVAYTKTPFLLFSWIPFTPLGFPIFYVAADFYSKYLAIVGIKHIYQFSWTKATLLIMVPYILFILLMLFSATTNLAPLAPS